MSESTDSLEYARHLILVPILHLPADMGSMAAELEAACVERLGRRHWRELLALIGNFWQEVAAEIERLGLDYARLDLYQDGLPVCGKELSIVEKAAALGSQNHRLLLSLVELGATLTGTEDPRLLWEEYRSVQAALVAPATAANSGPSAARTDATGAGIAPAQPMARRDAYIARRIGQTLRPKRTGMLFLGMLHHVESFLPADIVVRRLVPGVSQI